MVGGSLRIESEVIVLGNTPIPSRAIEYRPCGTGAVREYKLTPKELEEIRQKYPATKADKEFKKPIVHTRPDLTSEEQSRRANQRYQIQKEDDKMGGQRTNKEGPSCGLTKKVFLEQIAAGETVASIEKAWGMKYNTLYDWVKKWELKGITADKAQELLASGEPGKTQLLREKETLPLQPQVNMPELYKKALQEIEELKAALSVTQPISHDLVEELKAEAERWKAQATEAVALAGKAAEEATAKIERLKEIGRDAAETRDAATHELNRTIQECEILQDRLEQVTEERSREVNRLMAERDGAVAARKATELDLEQAETRCSQYAQSIDQLATECDAFQEELNRLITERDELQADNDRLRDQAIVEPQLANNTSEVHLLDRSIAELTRAKWILNRLSASGE